MRRPWRPAPAGILLCLALCVSAPGAAWADDGPRQVPRAASRDGIRDRVPAPRARARYCITARTPRACHWPAVYFRPRTAADRRSLLASGLLVAGGTVLLASGSRESVERFSDVGPILLPLAAFAAPRLQGDRGAARRVLLAYATMQVLTQGSKLLIDKTRPDGSDDDAYPSAHTAGAFLGAASLARRYGPRVGVPAYALALYTGLARVASGRHFLDDVIAGAGVGMFSAGLWDSISDARCCVREPYPRHARWRIEFGWGAAYQRENEITWPVGSGTTFDTTDGSGGGALPTARLTAQWFPSARHQVLLRVDPTEMRTSHVPTAPLTFGGTTFAAGTAVETAWLGEEYKLRWSYLLNPRSCTWTLRAGATLLLSHYEIALENGSAESEVGGTRFMPLPHAEIAYGLTPRLTALLGADGLPGVDEAGVDVEVALRYTLPRRWDVGLLYHQVRRHPQGSGLDNTPLTHTLYLTVGRSH